jgi:hypothetical protein
MSAGLTADDRTKTPSYFGSGAKRHHHRYFPTVEKFSITLIDSQGGSDSAKGGAVRGRLDWGIGLALRREWKEYQPLRDLLSIGNPEHTECQ